MLRRIRYGYFKGINFKLFYCTLPVEKKAQEKQEVIEYKRKFLRPFAKDMLLNRFNLDLFTYPEVYTESEVDKVNKLSEKLHSLLKLSREQKDKNDQSKIMDLLSQSGIFGLCVPERYLGNDYDYMMYGKILEVLSENMEYSLNVLNPQFLSTQAILYAGSEMLKERYLPRLVTGEMRGGITTQDLSSVDFGLSNILTTAYLDERERVYIINGKSEGIIGVDGAHFIIAYARTSERVVSAFVVPTDAQGVKWSSGGPDDDTTNHSGPDVWFDNVKVSVDNLLANQSGFEISRRIGSLNNMCVATSCSGLVKTLLAHTNEFVSARNVFGRPLAQRELVQYYLANFTNDVYAVESMAFYAAGLLKSFPANDLFIESSLSKMGGLESLSRLMDLSVKIMGTSAASGHPQLTTAFSNARLLQFSQVPSLESKQLVMKESVDYVLSNVGKGESMLDFIQRKSGRIGLRAVLEEKIITDSFRYNLHPRVAEITRHLQRDLREPMRFIAKITEVNDGVALKEDAIHTRLSIVLQNMFSIISVLSRASRSISIGLHNNEHEINTAELHYSEKILQILSEAEELRRISDNIDTINDCAQSIKEMGGYFVLGGSKED